MDLGTHSEIFMNRQKTQQEPPTEADLTDIQELGRLLFAPHEVARIRGRHDIEVFGSQLANGRTPEAAAYQKGRLLSEVQIRKTLLALAAEGSLQHTKECLKLLSEVRAAIEESR